jgi:transcription initiation factor TFIIE subunit alpha
MIEDPLVKELLSKIVEKDHEETLKKNFRERYHPEEEIPEGIDNLIRALELPPEEIQYIVEDIKNTVEKTIIPIIQSLIDGIETDEKIAEKTGIKLNIVRKILYKLYDLKIANYKRSKNPETQWFTYSWKFDEEELINKIKRDCEEKKSNLNEKLEEERNNIFFVCPLGHVRYNFDEASDEDFFCPCGEEVEFQDNAPIIENIESQIKQIDKDLKAFTKKVEKR